MENVRIGDGQYATVTKAEMRFKLYEEHIKQTVKGYIKENSQIITDFIINSSNVALISNHHIFLTRWFELAPSC